MLTVEELEREIEKLRKQLGRKPHCRCGTIATRLCDQVLARSIVGFRTLELICSRPLCERCARSDGEPIFICGADGSIEYEDFCPEHPARPPNYVIVSELELYRRAEKCGGEIVGRDLR